ncbi:hypothetical protein NDU88_001528 [Pleurodeles waltl]|uniref:Uncharacterized protein n=1 Tax=Pleurodeles waltl TaxID=8319 RepID=A0AAV7T0L8_PLEWA|nr:hypothetical protein NDU88_001528 [Pleurodeles waltl]
MTSWPVSPFLLKEQAEDCKTARKINTLLRAAFLMSSLKMESTFCSSPRHLLHLGLGENLLCPLLVEERVLKGCGYGRGWEEADRVRGLALPHEDEGIVEENSREMRKGLESVCLQRSPQGVIHLSTNLLLLCNRPGVYEKVLKGEGVDMEKDSRREKRSSNCATGVGAKQQNTDPVERSKE